MKIRRCMALVCSLWLLCMMLLPMTAFGETTIVISGSDVSRMQKVFSDTDKASMARRIVSGYCTLSGNALYVMDDEGNKGTSGFKILSLNTDGTSMTFDGQAFDSADKKAKGIAMKAFVESLQAAEVSTSTRQTVADRMNEASQSVNTYLIGMAMDSANADIFTAMKWVSPMLGFLRILIGVGVIILVMLLMFSTVMDLAYIGLPVWREAQADKKGATGEKPFGVSNEALSTVREVESGINDGQGEYKNAYWLYFRRRATTYIVLAICILYLVAGELGGLIQGLLNLVSGFTS